MRRCAQRAREELRLAQSHQRGSRHGECAGERQFARPDRGEARQVPRGDPGLIPGATDMAAKNLKVTLVKSLAGQLKNISASVRGLGLRKPHQTVEVADTP